MLKDHLATNSVFRTEARKSELSQNVQMALEVARWRQPAYAALWSMMEIVSFRRPVELTPDIRRQLADNLTEFYYRDGHALYLSVASMECFMVARDLLCSQEDVSDAMIREEFSKLRTQMKVDLTVYTPEQLKSGLPLENRAYLQLEPHEIRL